MKNIYKLKFPSKEEGIEYLISNGIIHSEFIWGSGIDAVVYLEEGQIDIMSSNEYNFGEYEIHPITPNHQFYI